MIESQQDRELVLKQLAEAWYEGYMAALSEAVSRMNSGSWPKAQSNPYRREEEK